MENYKALNRDLVLEMQSMRETLQLLNREIFALRGDYMQKHEENIFLRRHCTEIVLHNCCQLLEIIEPESDVLQYLKHFIFNKSNDMMSDRWSNLSRRSAPIRMQARSRIMADELRRSSSVLKHNFRLPDKSPEPPSSYCLNASNKKSNSSPIDPNFMQDNENSKRSFNQSPEEKNILNGLQQKQQDNFLDKWSLNNAGVRDSINSRVDIIYEDEDESDPSEANDYNKDQQRISKGSKQRNSQCIHSPNNITKINKRKSPRNRSSATSINDQSSATHSNLGKTKSCSDANCTNSSLSNSNSSFKIRSCDIGEYLSTNRALFTSRHNVVPTYNASYCGNIAVNETDKSVQELRHLISSIRIEDNTIKPQSQDNRPTFAIEEVDDTANISFNKVMNSTSYCRVPFPESPTNQCRTNADKNPVCVSTRPTLQRVHSSIGTVKSDVDDDNCNNSNRRMRNCKPINLQEPKLNAKLRNTSEKKSLTKDRKAKKGK